MVCPLPCSFLPPPPPPLPFRSNALYHGHQELFRTLWPPSTTFHFAGHYTAIQCCPLNVSKEASEKYLMLVKAVAGWHLELATVKFN